VVVPVEVELVMSIVIIHNQDFKELAAVEVAVAT
jgi:hypothetical protein